MINGFINFLKPPGMTSHDVVSVVRKLLGIKKVGHTGTLDPGVAGVLPLCAGKATRLSEYVMDRPKSYRGEITLGITTDSQDAYGSILNKKDCTHLQKEEFTRVMGEFSGHLEQIPPMTSAIRMQGVRLYQLARQGIEIERKPKKVTIYSLDIVKINWSLPFPKIIFDVTCSKGTYIRTLCHDIGERLGVGAYMSFLIRTQTGPFQILNAWTIEEILDEVEKMNLDFILPLTEGIPFLPVINVNEKQSGDISHGRSVCLPPDNYCYEKIYQIQAPDQTLLALGQVVQEGFSVFKLKPNKVFADK